MTSTSLERVNRSLVAPIPEGYMEDGDDEGDAEAYASFEDIRAVVRELHQDPVRYVKGILGHRVWQRQADILRSVSVNARTSVKACHASSKSFTAAEAALWWITHFEDGIAITMAPVFKQVRLVMWGEIHRMVRGSRLVEWPKVNQTELRISDDRYLIGISTDAGVNLQGFHGRILIILDEAVGIANDIHEAIEGIRAGGDVRILALGNPTVPGGWFYDTFHPSAVGWNTITISAFDSPNLRSIEPRVSCDFDVPGVYDPYQKDLLATLLVMEEEELHDNPWPFLTTRQWVKEKWLEWGVSGNPLWWSRVLGQFPPQADNALISLDWLEKSRWAGPREDRYGNREDGRSPVDVGIDVAGPGEDETVVAIRCGGYLIDMWVFNEPDPRGAVSRLLLEWAHRIHSINIDSNGIGYGLFLHVADLMAERWPKIEVRGINVGAAPFDTLRFANLKAELYWNLRVIFQEGGIWGIEDETLRSQLLSIIYEIRPNGKTMIESKEEARKRGVKSPDRAEALMLCYADIFAPPEGTVTEATLDRTVVPDGL